MTGSLLNISTALALLISPGLAAASDTLDVVAQFEIQAPEPSTSGYIFTRMGIAETLVNADAQGNLTPGLATGWSVSADGLTWSFTLRKDVIFHDGTAMTAETVLNALEIAQGKPGPLNDLPITGISAGEGAITVTLSEPVGALPAYLAYFRYQVLAPASYGPDGAGVAIIGTGPYRVTGMEPPLSLDATAFPNIGAMRRISRM